MDVNKWWTEPQKVVEGCKESFATWNGCEHMLYFIHDGLKFLKDNASMFVGIGLKPLLQDGKEGLPPWFFQLHHFDSELH